MGSDENLEDRSPHIFYEESRVLIQIQNKRLIYGNIQGKITEDMSKIGLVKYVMGKNTHGTEKTFWDCAWVDAGDKNN